MLSIHGVIYFIQESVIFDQVSMGMLSKTLPLQSSSRMTKVTFDALSVCPSDLPRPLSLFRLACLPRKRQKQKART